MKKTITVEHELPGGKKLTLQELRNIVMACQMLTSSSIVEIQMPQHEDKDPRGGWYPGYIKVTGQESSPSTGSWRD